MLLNCSYIHGFNIKKFLMWLGRRNRDKTAERTASNPSEWRAEPRGWSRLARALLAVFLGLVEPALQDDKGLRLDFKENHAGA